MHILKLQKMRCRRIRFTKISLKTAILKLNDQRFGANEPVHRFVKQGLHNKTSTNEVKTVLNILKFVLELNFLPIFFLNILS